MTTEEPLRARRRLGVGAAIVVALVALAVTVGIGILRGATAPVDDVPLAVSTTGAAVSGAKLFVHVSGAVRVPGLYRLDDGARVVDAVAAAGGFADGAAQDAVNLARPLTDGEQLVVPIVGAQPASTGAAAAPVDGRVNLNTADATALDALPRIGPALAARIVAWREQNGRFTSVDDLLAVPGIGDKMLESLRDLVTV
ncbi:ComEA family DNA-binding protein [Microbacterium rhizosphaerae]|uniref:ComEA family DNA-binding protein n=1 Tax=Microbacterium rhizosphaerae TaxID=1678237 RepID=A0ABZ0SQX8_9MICO|nr:ComEA family DNA-binding protein [Microbacterium rhizosphaerae]WPR91374.1 ComEA family DNA-binding protein [Microbacterium rhizosphaerae]